MTDLLSAAANRVAAKRRELELRLQQLHNAPIAQKLASAGVVTSTVYELLDHQATFNDAAVAAIAELGHRCELLAAKAGCSFATIAAAG